MAAVVSAVRVRITGRVQGVGFRRWTASVAEALHIAGWVRNDSDGSVEVFAQGQEDALSLFCARLKKGPPYSEVDGFFTERAAAGQYRAFSVR